MGKSFLAFMLLLTVSGSIFSQTEYQPVDFTVQLKSMHLDRGFAVTGAPMIGIDLHYRSENKKMKAGVWGGTGTTGTYREFDHYLTYQNHGFKVELWDINNFSDKIPNNKKFFNYNARETGHLIDLKLSYKYSEKFPLTVLSSTMIYGWDRGKRNKQNLYSTYLQLTYGFINKGSVAVDIFAAGVFALNPEKGSSANLYLPKSNLVNLGVTVFKTLKVADFDLMISATPAWNPGLEQGNIQLALHLF